MVKDVSKYLFKRDPKCVNPSFMEDGLDITGFVDECLLLGLSISGAVNKLTALLTAVKFQNPNSAAIHHIEEARKKRCTEKTARYKRKRTSSESDQPTKKRK